MVENRPKFIFKWKPKLPESPYWIVHLIVFFMVMALGATLWFFTFKALMFNEFIH